MVSANENFVLVRETFEPVNSCLEFDFCPVSGKVAGMDEEV